MRKILVGLACLAVLGAACGGDDTANTPGDGAAAGGSTTLTAADFSFDPTSLSAAPGDSIDYTNSDDVEHNFTVEDLGIDQDVEGGKSATIDLGHAAPGTYDFFCKYHKDTMTGTLEVTG
ncbi:MAG: Cupredoxin-like domain [Actinomycetota bacterium]|jgi:plastocyanin|nr:Cupredoxin-like domain [Actinomycetota bacterium]